MDRLYLKSSLVEDILVPQDASKIFVSIETFPRGLNGKKLVIHEQFQISGTSR